MNIKNQECLIKAMLIALAEHLPEAAFMAIATVQAMDGVVDINDDSEFSAIRQNLTKRLFPLSSEDDGEKITFQKFVENKGHKLVPWQEEAANDFLKHLPKRNGRGSGKSFLIQLLVEFVEAHGNDFEVQ